MFKTRLFRDFEFKVNLDLVFIISHGLLEELRLNQFDFGFERMMTYIPIVPEEGHVIVDNELVEALSFLDDFSVEMLGPFVLQRYYLAIL